VIWSVDALLLGLIVVVVLAALCSPLVEQPDPSMVWEGRIAVGFAAIGFAGPFWLAQGILTLVATFDDDVARPGWLWAWFVVAPLAGASPPAAALVRAVRRITSSRARTTYSSRGVGAVAQEANFAWAATTAEPDWLLCRTPSLPSSWPPAPGGPAVWFCYAERQGPLQMIEVAAPWARITLEPGESAWPVVERLSDAVEPLGSQVVRPVEPRSGATAPKPSKLLDLVYRGDPDGRLGGALSEWRSLNERVAAHPAVAGHLPPG
jgi:hypothetical protein